ncbi:hypothetical protein METBIDRAFT_87572 [Metschnikowia bicuspidata var. bicuspidata NRRL YB-4993]|uniref:Dipeptidase n=1 Tax=Metschnikowia bicuspidata var. bicuspidata NRRL YB-4993 TaxID=869754 RepID=A0A1A0HBF2_9ASCO|nr:hypothetical protein METBIDRAFT_87572 [Metschnikowia bicuspidata var. bicuspidata NRRL YB-4993]OBA21464.1 hypothetical protein METBIDRAFT_87572 [Metschnikowia bicuspidata var. bicuspidata NRRL YB-4993]
MVTFSRYLGEFDTHNDFPYLVREQLHYQVQDNEKFTFKSGLTCHTDLVKLVKGRVGVQFFSCFIECKDTNPLYQDFNKPTTVVRDTMEQIDFVRRLADMYPENLKYVSSSAEAIAAFKNHKLAVTLCVKGLHQVDASLGVLRRYFDLGCRYITLTHNCDNPFATAASSVTGRLPDRGLSEFGRKCIREMNRLGMMVDLSHVSLQIMWDALKTTASPVIFLHSSAHALCEHPQNVPDDVLLKVKENNDVVCVNFYPDFISSSGSGKATLQDAVNHILHIAHLIGWEHVGLGSDFDGIPEGPTGLEDVSKYPDLIKAVMDASDATDDQIAMLMGKKVLRESIEDSTWAEREWKFFSYSKAFPEVYPGAREECKNDYGEEQSLNVFKDLNSSKTIP